MKLYFTLGNVLGPGSGLQSWKPAALISRFVLPIVLRD